jgi:hypothetical protein
MKTSYKNDALQLLYLNVWGCAVSVHIFYGLSNYKALHYFAHKHLKCYSLYSSLTFQQQQLTHFIADGIIHGSPILVCSFFKPSMAYSFSNHIWLLPAITQVSYSYLLIQSFDVSILYNYPYPYSKYHIYIGWIGTFVSYFILNIIWKIQIINN